MEICWNAVVLSVLVSTVAAIRYNCYQCEDYDQVHVEVRNYPREAERIRKDILFNSNKDCRVRDASESKKVSPAGCGNPGDFYAGCASGDVIAWFNFTTPVRGVEVPARINLRARFRDCYARRRSEEVGCRSVGEHQDLLIQVARKLIKDRPIKISAYRGDVCLCEGHGCNADLPENEPQGGATSLIMHTGLLLGALLVARGAL